MEMVIFPIRTTLSRVAIPVIGLVLVALLAILYINHPHVYNKFISATILYVQYSHPFIDWEWIISSIECWHKGVDVYLNNTCYVPIANMSWVYSPVWLRLTFIRFAEGCTNFFGLSFAVLFFLSLAYLPRRRTGTLDFVTLLFSAISSATVFALERANADVIMFLMIIVGVLACGSRLPVRLAGYALITLAGLLKFYPLAALIIVVHERPAIFATIAFAATAVLGGLVFSYHDEVLQVVVSLSSWTVPFNPFQWGARDLPGGLSKVATRLFDQDPTSAEAIGQLVYNVLLLLLILQALAAAIWLGRRCRLQSAVANLDKREADFLLAGAALICGCFFAGESALYRAIFLLLALPGLLALAHQFPLHLARVAFRSACVAIVFVLWYPFVRKSVRLAVAALGKPINSNYLLMGDNGLDRALQFVVWLCDQLAWWWIASVLLAVLGALVLNSELWAALSPLLPLSPGACIARLQPSGGSTKRIKQLYHL